MVVARKQQQYRGLESALPTLDVAELGFTTNTEKLFIGTGVTNIEIAKQQDVDDLNSEVDKIKIVQGKRYGVKWDGVNAACTRLYDAAAITTTTTNFRHNGTVNASYSNPFDALYPWSMRKLVNVNITTYRSLYAAGGDIKDAVVAWEGDPDFAGDGTNGFVGVYTPEFWGKINEVSGGTEFIVADEPLPGYTHFEETIGARWFGVADGTGITSKPGIPVINEAMSAIHARATAVDMTLDDVFTWSADTLLLVVEYATLNTQTAVGSGVDGVYVQSIRPYVAETGVNRVVMTDAQAANFHAGVIIDIGTTDGAYNVARRTVTSVEEYVPNAAYAMVNFDGAAIDTLTTHYVSAHGKANEADAGIGSMSGYLGTNSKANAYYRGRVAHANFWRYVLGAYRETGNGKIWMATDRDQAASYDALNTAVHIDTGFILPTTSNYVSELHLTMSAILAPFAKAVAGNSSNPVGDYCYVPSLATGNTVLRVGGNASNGANAGRFYGDWSDAASDSHCSISGLPFLKTP